MIDREAYGLLQDVIRREGRSFLQYAGESFPWSTTKDQETMGKLKNLMTEEREGAEVLSRFLVKHRLAPPYLGSYPSYFASYNYLSLDKLLPLLLVHQHKMIEALTGDLAQLKDGESRKALQQALVMKNRHLQALQELNGPAAA